MAIQTDVKVTKPLVATGVFQTQTDANCTFRTRIKAIYVVKAASAGSVVVRDGAGGPVLLEVPTSANAGIPVVWTFPGQGIIASNGLHGTLTNVASATIVYG